MCVCVCPRPRLLITSGEIWRDMNLIRLVKQVLQLLYGNYGAAACDVICLEALVLPGGKTMERLYGNGRKFASFSLTSPALVIEHLQY